MTKVYISSTLSDLAEHRDILTRRLRDAGFIAFESYNADRRPTVQSCLSDVGGCDAYVAIVGHRYGTIPAKKNSNGYSYTELEMRAADAIGLDTYVLVLDDEASPQLADDPEMMRRFRQWICEGDRFRPARFKTIEEFRSKVAGVITALLSDRPSEGSLPRDLGHGCIGAQLKGRDAELQKIERCFVRRTKVEQAPVFVVTGASGVGKTTLAREFWSRNRDEFKEGAVFVEAGALGSVNEIEAAIRETGRGGPLSEETLRSALDNPDVLIVLDDLQSKIKGIKKLFRPGGAHWLIPTRVRGMPLELGLDDSCSANLGVLPEPAALELLWTIVGTDRRDENPPAARRICESLGFHPHAIRIVANTIRLGGADLERAARTLGIKGKKTALADDRYSEVTASFDFALKELAPHDEDEKKKARFYACLGACSSGRITFESARVASGYDESDTAECLQALCEHCLLEGNERDAYDMHALLREHAKLRARSEQAPSGQSLYEASTERLSRYWLERELPSIADRKRYDTQLMSAAKWYASQDEYDRDTVRNINENLGGTSDPGALAACFHDLTEQARARGLDDEVVLCRIHELKYLVRARDYDRAQELSEMLGSDLERIQDPEERMVLERRWRLREADLAAKRGNQDAATKSIDRAIELARTCGAPEDLANTLDKHARMSMAQKRWARAVPAAAEALAATRKMGDLDRVFASHILYVRALRGAGKNEESMQALRRVYSSNELAGFRRSLAATIIHDLKDASLGDRIADELIGTLNTIVSRLTTNDGPPDVLVPAAIQCANVLARRGKLADALDYLRKTVNHPRQITDAERLTGIIRSLAKKIEDSGETELLWDARQLDVDVARATGNPRLEATAHNRLGEYRAKGRQTGDSVRFEFEAQLKIADEHDLPLQASFARVALARLELRRREPEADQQALVHAKRAVAVSRELEGPAGERSRLEAHRYLGLALSRLGRTKDAVVEYLRAIALTREVSKQPAHQRRRRGRGDSRAPTTDIGRICSDLKQTLPWSEARRMLLEDQSAFDDDALAILFAYVARRRDNEERFDDLRVAVAAAARCQDARAVARVSRSAVTLIGSWPIDDLTEWLASLRSSPGDLAITAAIVERLASTDPAPAGLDEAGTSVLSRACAAVRRCELLPLRGIVAARLARLCRDHREFDLGLSMSRECLAAAERAGDPVQQSFALFSLANALAARAPERSLDHVERLAREFPLTLDDPKPVLRMLANLAKNAQLDRNNHLAIRAGEVLCLLAEARNEPRFQAIGWNAQARAAQRQGRWDMAARASVHKIMAESQAASHEGREHEIGQGKRFEDGLRHLAKASRKSRDPDAGFLLLSQLANHLEHHGCIRAARRVEDMMRPRPALEASA